MTYNRDEIEPRTRALTKSLIEQDKYNSRGLCMIPDPNGWTIHVCSAQGAKTVFNNPDLFIKLDTFSAQEGTLSHTFLGGRSLAMLNGNEWRRQRRVFNPIFQGAMPVDVFGNLVFDVFAEIDKTEIVEDMADITERYALDAIGKSILNFDFEATSNPNSEWRNTYNSFSSGLIHPMFFILPFLDQEKFMWLFPERAKERKNLQKFLGMVKDVIAEKKKIVAENAKMDIKGERDLITMMLDVPEEDLLTDDELLANVNIFFFAGHETTANALAFAIYSLAVDQEIQKKAREEVLEIMGDSSEDTLPTLEMTKGMTYLNQIIKETLRKFVPVLGVAPRVAEKDTQIDGTFIPKGSIVTVDVLGIHRNDNVWENPDEFNPERFAPGGEAELKPEDGFSWLPFGRGKRQCIGMNFSLAEQRVLLSMLLKRYSWELPEGASKDISYEGLITIRPKDLRVKFTKRY
ncbi:cytochrome P450 [Backusella circina FSU 941]|nr:cytochrome P450 [Backusella circina FSU 941]